MHYLAIKKGEWGEIKLMVQQWDMRRIFTQKFFSARNYILCFSSPVTDVEAISGISHKCLKH